MTLNNFRSCFLITVTLLFGIFLSCPELSSQDDPIKKQKTRLSVNYFDLGKEGREVRVELKTRAGRSYEALANMPINLFMGELDADNLIGKLESDKNGKTVFKLDDKQLDAWHLDSSIYFVAEFEGNEKYKSADKDIEVELCHAELDMITVDSVNYAQFSVWGIGDQDEKVPYSELNVMFYVERMFGQLPISEAFETTDEEGVLRVEFPKDIPGDKDGLVTVIAKVDDHETLGNLLYKTKIDWGVPLIEEESEARTLWGNRDNSPLFLMIIVNALILGIWGVIVYIVYNLFSIRTLGRYQ